MRFLGISKGWEGASGLWDGSVGMGAGVPGTHMVEKAPPSHVCVCAYVCVLKQTNKQTNTTKIGAKSV